MGKESDPDLSDKFKVVPMQLPSTNYTDVAKLSTYKLEHKCYFRDEN